MDNEATVGTVDWDGKTYEIDWPYDIETGGPERETFGAIYLDGEQVGECCEQFGETWTDASQVIEAAREVIQDGGTEDQD